MANPSTDEQAALTAASPIDGRYRGKVGSVSASASETALMRHRVRVECEWFLHLSAEPAINALPPMQPASQETIRAIYEQFDIDDARRIKTLEATTNHDVKAVEYFVKEKIVTISEAADYAEFVHFACTSEDINNLAHALMLDELRNHVVEPDVTTILQALESFADEYAAQPMLSRTHGQAASPTTLGKEMNIFAQRIRRQLNGIMSVPLLGKMNGAVGNYNAHAVAYPDADWPAIAHRFVQSLGLTQNPLTTQIEPHDYVAELFHAMTRLNNVLLDLVRDIWAYIAIDYFQQIRVEGETGSSTMPHKVNPIDFENAEGNLGLANALLRHMADKLVVSRWQRDLSDSTVLRNIGGAFGYATVAFQSVSRGLAKIAANPERMRADLDQSWEVLGEAVQTVMRRHHMSEPYERLKAATRGERLTRDGYAQLLEALDLPPDAHDALRELTPATYVGIAQALAKLRT